MTTLLKCDNCRIIMEVSKVRSWHKISINKVTKHACSEECLVIIKEPKEEI